MYGRVIAVSRVLACALSNAAGSRRPNPLMGHLQDRQIRPAWQADPRAAILQGFGPPRFVSWTLSIGQRRTRPQCDGIRTLSRKVARGNRPDGTATRVVVPERLRSARYPVSRRLQRWGSETPPSCSGCSLVIEAWSELTFRHVAGLEQHGENSSKPMKPLVERLPACAEMDKVQVRCILPVQKSRTPTHHVVRLPCWGIHLPTR